MPITINGRIYMNLQEAVAWLLNNNALPFQCKTNFVADTEIPKTDIINPAPAELKIGSLVLFADGIVGTVNAVTTNGFKVGSEGTDLSDGVPHITDIQLNASQHLIFTMSEGDPIDAGLVKEISSFSIDASQHLVANYNDGTTQDLGAIFTGNVNIAGNFTANSIIENMSGYSFGISQYLPSQITLNMIYAGAVKNGNKLTLVFFGEMTRTNTVPSGVSTIASFRVPSAVASKLYPYNLGGEDIVANGMANAASGNDAASCKDMYFFMRKYSQDLILHFDVASMNALDLNTPYIVRLERTFLLSDSLAS